MMAGGGVMKMCFINSVGLHLGSEASLSKSK